MTTKQPEEVIEKPVKNTMTCAEVKGVLAMHHGGGHIKDDNMTRELIIHKTSDKDAVLWLGGTPPKGYCIAANGIVSLYGVWGERFKIFEDTTLDFGDAHE